MATLACGMLEKLMKMIRTALATGGDTPWMRSSDATGDISGNQRQETAQSLRRYTQKCEGREEKLTK